ncbi:MAG: GNAT family N-acetyltransferase [Halioglobus sp.]
MTKGAGSYRVMPHPELTEGCFSARAVDPEHIEPIRLWRNAQIDVLRQTRLIEPEEQVRYFSSTVWPDKASNSPGNILLVYLKDGVQIGYGGLVHIAWDYSRAEVSFLLDPVAGKNEEEISDLFARWLRLMKRLAFGHLGLTRLTTETYAMRTQYIRLIEEGGFKYEGRLREHVRVDGRSMDALLHGCLSTESLKQNGTNALEPGGVLVTSAACKAPLVRAMKTAVSKVNGKLRVIAGDLDSNSPARFVADCFWTMPLTEPDQADKILEECKQRGIRLILPTRDGELAFWGERRELFAHQGITVAVSDAESVYRCLDKLEFARFGEEIGLSVIATSEDLDSLDSELFVVKERYGAGSQSLGLRLDRDAALIHGKQLDRPIYQPFVQGQEISIDAWMDESFKPRGVVLRRRDQVVNGESQVTTTFRNPQFEATALAAFTALQLRGPAVMQAMIDADGNMWIVECNARFGGASTAAIAAGLDMFYWNVLEKFSPDVVPSFNRIDGEVRQVRVPADIIIYDPDL